MMSLWPTPKPRMRGCHHAGMWVYRLGLAKAKELALTGEAVAAPDAIEIGLTNRAVPFDELHDAVDVLAQKLASIPPSQPAAMKLVVNEAYENMGLRSTQLLGSVMKHRASSVLRSMLFINVSEKEAVSVAVVEHDGPFGDYSQAPASEKPDPRNVIA